MSQHLVSIGLPVFNGERYVGRAIESVLSQTYGRFELVISDNGSTDSTADICLQYARTDPRIRYIRQSSSRGGAWNFNEVARLGKGRYFQWLCHDDVFHARKLERTVAALDEAPADVVLCHTGTVLVDANGDHLGPHDDGLHVDSDSPHERLRQLVTRLKKCNALYGLLRREALLATRLMGAYGSADKVLLAELALLGRFRRLPDNLFYRRIHEEQTTRAHRSARDRATWFDPHSASKRFVAPRWRLLSEHIRAIHHVPLPTRERGRCYRVLMTDWVPQHRTQLAGDVKVALLHLRSSGAS